MDRGDLPVEEGARHFDISPHEGTEQRMRIDPSKDQAPTDLVAIPQELREFLKQTPSSLLIKGAAGTGKTSLALAILHGLDGRGGFLYLSTRASPSQLFMHRPWLKDWVRPKKSKRSRTMAGSSAVPENFVDSRLDEPTQLFERITNQLMDASAPTIVIDTWDSLGDFKDEDSLQSNLRVLLAWCERAGARLILIDEDPADMTFDALVDGIVTLEQRDIDGRRAREIILTKLQGTNIQNPRYFFTLKDAKFRSFGHLEPDKLVIDSGSVAIEPDPTAEDANAGEYIPTGHSALDSELGGGLPAGSLVNIALSRGVDSRVPLFLLEKAMGSFVNSGHGVILVPFEGLAPGFVESYLRSSVPSSRQSLIRHTWQKNGDAGKAQSPSGGGVKDGEGSTDNMHVEETSAFLVILGPGSVEDTPGKTPGHEVEHLAHSVYSARGLGFVVTRDKRSAVSEHLSANSALELEIASKSGTLLLQPQAPFSKLFVIDVQYRSGRPVIQLEPIV
jgi:KaiC/GvpD/RAD55 family RecA-like ATPase